MWVGLVVGRETLLPLTVPLVISYAIILIRIGKISIQQVLLPAAIGISIDSAFTLFGMYSFSNTNLLLPIWLITLWIAFSTTLTQSLAFIGKYWPVAAVAGAIAFPFNYAIGERLGAVAFADPYILTLLTVGLTWLFCFPLLFFVVDERFKKKLAT